MTRAALRVFRALLDKGADANLPLGVLEEEQEGQEGRCVGMNRIQDCFEHIYMRSVKYS